MTHIGLKSGSTLLLAALAVLAVWPATAQAVNPWSPQVQTPAPAEAAPRYYAEPQNTVPVRPLAKPADDIYAPADLDRRLSAASPVPAPIPGGAPPVMGQGGNPYGAPGQPMPGYGAGFTGNPGGYGPSFGPGYSNNFGNPYGNPGGYGGSGWPGMGGFGPGMGSPFAGFAPFGIW